MRVEQRLRCCDLYTLTWWSSQKHVGNQKVMHVGQQAGRRANNQIVCKFFALTWQIRSSLGISRQNIYGKSCGADVLDEFSTIQSHASVEGLAEVGRGQFASSLLTGTFLSAEPTAALIHQSNSIYQGAYWPCGRGQRSGGRPQERAWDRGHVLKYMSPAWVGDMYLGTCPRWFLGERSTPFDGAPTGGPRADREALSPPKGLNGHAARRPAP